MAIATRLNRPAWVDLASSDAAASRDFYAKLFGWNVELNPDPQYGGYAVANIGDQQVGGIGPTQSPDQPTAWSLYIGTDDAAATAEQAQAAGGSVAAPAFDVGDQGKMAVLQDPSGALISVWQAAAMRPFRSDSANTLGWAELNARNVRKAVPFYERLFGWTTKESAMGEGQPPYIQFELDGQSIAGAWEMNPSMPPSAPSYWQVYFNVDDVDAAFQKAIGLGATEMIAPQAYPGGRFAIVADPQGATIGLLQPS
jgi:predicted enzyme related to lactoylglutathione lyase